MDEKKVTLEDGFPGKTETKTILLRSRFFSLADQFRYGLVLMVGLSLLLTGSILIYLSFQAQLQELEIVQRERSRAVASEINAYIDDLQRKLGYLARVRGLTNLSPEIQHDLLVGLTRHNKAYETVAILDSVGQVVSAISPYGPTTLEDQSGSILFSRAFKQQEDFVGPVELDLASRLPVVAMAVPIRNWQDEVDGVLMAKVNLKFLWYVVSQASVGETGYIYVYDERNFLIAQTGDTIETFTLENISDHQFLRDLSSSVEAPLIAYRGLRGVDVLGTVAPIGSLGWHVVVDLPTAEAYAPLRNMLLVMSSALLISMITAVGLGFAFSRQVVGPLQCLTEAATQIGAGNLDVKANVVSRNELGILATTFNEMTAQLRELVGGLEYRVKERTTELVKSNEQLRREITERGQAEEALQQTHRDLATKAAELEAANAELEQYAYVVSHDIRAPLRAIRNYADFIREDLKETLDEDLKLYLDGLSIAVREADELARDLLELSRIGRKGAPVETVDVGVFLRKLLAILGPPAGVEIVMADEWPTIVVEPVLLGQIFQNLIGNAIKFNRSPRKRVELGWQAVSPAPPKEESVEGAEGGARGYEFFVCDNGIGIDPRYHEQIFRVFEQLHTREEYEGTGVGLAIVKKASSKLGGSVRVESKPGEGSTFFVTLPKAQRSETFSFPQRPMS